ncbi:hypothetical protein [Chitinophaga sp. HK235]|uniref:hypothetical protein n=1 Tax=Chitinophaga sp. HK235 TaxID=2952571 RepID=UPI001BA4F1B5|nr:hypothetical protein [Chitinophaga sp. HK235]
MSQNIFSGQAWTILFSQPILGTWLDNKALPAFQPGDTYTTAAGITITVTRVTEVKVIRMKLICLAYRHASE